MKNQELWQEEQDIIKERLELAWNRIQTMVEEHSTASPFQDYFHQTAENILKVEREFGFDYVNYSMETLQAMNQAIYEELFPERYATSYANPEYAVAVLGEEYGPVLCFLYTELRGLFRYARELRLTEFTCLLELFIEIYNLFEAHEELKLQQVQNAIYYFYYDYCDVFVPYRVREQYDSQLDFCTSLVETADLTDLRYLYAYGEYISENELRTAEFLNQLSQEEVDALAFTYTDGYREGFEIAGIDLSRKKYVNLIYAIGQERIVRAAITQFRAMGLEPIIYRPAVSRLNQKQNRRGGISSTSPNRQYEYDHRLDEGLYLNKAFLERKLEVLAQGYEAVKHLTELYAGPAVIETFGETPFEPARKPGCIELSRQQQELSVEYATQSSKIINRYVRREEYSFTIIAYPSPEIGEDFEAIFQETVKVNTLDKKLYRRIQEILIEELNQAKSIRVLGKGNNRTDILVMMHPLKNPESETNFENCLADVNIPVGEVFTSPQLTGTNGLLNVSEVFLNDLKFVDLEIRFENGMITEYTCQNFENEADNIRFVKENLLVNRKTLPIGEFAIGTNTTAYVMANRYQIVYKLPILIVEKMGPHFAVGDTCYSYSEENRLFNPDGKEIVAKDNECSLLRKEDVSKAYFNCHTDITIPYDEIGAIISIHADGTEVEIMKDGRFVLNGTEELNRPFEQEGI
ncbi:MAG: aminopeptidase [Bacteroides sp.]|nr:aminopeptidase [Bacteroides sp.]MCM1550585.1 aminopeptidase [Clostridium sp.]